MYNSIKIRKKIEAGELVLLCSSLLSDPAVSELLAFCGCDMVWIDMEHAAFDNKDVEQHIIAAHSGGAAAIVRVPGNDPAMVKKILDMGTDAILFPLVRSAEEARQAIQACCYPPKGVRGWNPIRAAKYGVVDSLWYKSHADELILKFIMMEDIHAAHEIDEILAIEELDGLMIGPCDLSGSMGKLTDIYAEDVQATIRNVVKKCRDRNKYIGVALGCGAPPKLYRYWIDMGVQMLSFGQDMNLLVQAAKSNIQNISAALEESSDAKTPERT